MAQIESFDPVIGRNPSVILLGSMPGVASLQAAQYYAHPRNAFWPIMGNLFGFDHEVGYRSRIAEIERLPIILWDSLKACHRPGSLDSSIDAETAEANDFAGLLKQHPQIRAVFCNGATSEKYFRKLALPAIPEPHGFEVLRMPSTSPANAGMKFEQKLEAWRRILDYTQ